MTCDNNYFIFISSSLFIQDTHHVWSSLQGFVPLYSMKQMPEESVLLNPRAVSLLCSRYAALRIHHFVITTAKAALELCIPHQPFLVGENMVQHNTSCLLLSHLEKGVIVNAFQEPSGLLMSFCVVLPTDSGIFIFFWQMMVFSQMLIHNFINNNTLY